MEIKRYEFLLRADTPIAHHAESFGNQAVIFRRKLRQPDGAWANVPFVTGDTLRHQLREAVAYAYLDAAGLLDRGSLSEAALRLLFAGGMVTGVGDASVIKLDQYREMCELCPPLSLLGGCANNRVIPGRLIVDDAILVCHESMHVVPEWVRDKSGAIDTARSHVELHQRVRMDPVLDPGKRKLLTDVADKNASTRMELSERAHGNSDPVDREATKSSMMPRSFEAIAAGSLFFWSVQATCYSDLDVDTFHSMIAAFLGGRARVGGKSGVGFGRIAPVAAVGITVNRPADNVHAVDATALAPKVGSIFRAHVSERRDRIVAFMSGVNA